MVMKSFLSFITHPLTPPKSTELSEVTKSVQVSSSVYLKHERLNNKRNTQQHGALGNAF